MVKGLLCIRTIPAPWDDGSKVLWLPWIRHHAIYCPRILVPVHNVEQRGGGLAIHPANAVAGP